MHQKYFHGKIETWTNFTLLCKIKLISGGLHLNFRVSNQGRYYIPFNSGEIVLKKDNSKGEKQQ